MIAPTTAGLLIALAKVNLAAGAAVLAVLAIRRPVRARFGARAAYALWLAPLAAAVAVLAPHPQIVTPMSPIVLSAEAAADAFVAQAPAATSPSLPVPDAASLLFAAWLAGALAAGGLVLWRQSRFTRAMGRLTPADAPRVFRAESAHTGPAVVGVFRPRIVAPADFEARFAPDERALILAHERTHLASGDAAINALACALQCLGWFNPLIHLGVRSLRIDQELACDAAVIGRFPDRRRAYAELLLKTQIATHPLPLGCHWPAGAEHPLKERIAMLKSPAPKLPLRVAGLAVAGLTSLAAGGLAWAAQPGPGAAERLEAEVQNAAHPNYTCDRAREAQGVGCKIISVPNWLALPTRDDLMRHYPPAALKAGLSAKVTISCALTAEGLYTGCRAIGTEVRAPGGGAVDDGTKVAFGKAALALSRYYQARRLDRTDRPWGGRAIMPIFFTPEGTPHLPGPPGSIPAPLPAGPAAPPSPAQVSEAAPTVRKVLAAFGAPHTVVAPDWARKPSGEDVARVYPKADQDRIGGAAAMDCRFAQDGRLTGCKVANETPPGDGFGAAALALAPLFQAKPLDKAGAAVAGGAIRIPIRFLPTPPPGVVTKPDWLEKPDGADIARYYPPEAVKGNWEAKTVLSCAVTKDGRLTGCAAKGGVACRFGAPAGLDEAFRQASLELAGRFRMRPQTVDGVPTADGRINIPIRFSLPNDPEAVARLNALRDPGPASPT